MDVAGRVREKSASAEDRQSQELVSFLEVPASYPHGPREVRSIQTHISWVFVTTPFVFKVKKAVNLGFLDFSTLEKRRHFCQRELELNRRLCPSVYLDIVPIYKSASGFSFNPEGEIAEYSVKMRELPGGWFLSELLVNRLVDENEINRVISCLHRFYESQPPSPVIEEWGRPEKLKISTDENFVQVGQFVGRTISPAALETIRHFTNHFYAANEKLFRERVQRHRIRDCHGDLHLDHIHITPEATTIFDCIEFNDRFRFIDIANDLAFLAREFGDDGILKVSDFYKCYRAVVRGKVQSIQGISMKTTTPKEHAEQAARYFRLALRYAVSGSEPLVLAVMGRVGTGKTAVAKQLGNELDLPVFSSDEIRKTLARIPLTERTAAERRDDVYSEQMTEQTYKELLVKGLTALKTHGGVVLDATFSSQANRELLRQECAKAEVYLQVIELNVDTGKIESRLRARDQSVSEISDARLEDFEKLNSAYEPPSELVPGLIRISTDNAVSDAVKMILFRLAEKQSLTANDAN